MTSCKPRLLVVDDDPFVLDMLVILLEEKGYPVEAVENGKEALEVFGRHSDIGLVLTDMNMPVMDGLKLTGEIRQMDATVPILLLTAHDDQALTGLAREKGATGCLAKDENLMEGIAGVVASVLACAPVPMAT
ncbi:MAG: response regulator [Geobacteraceae bacterium]|nr:response regulator [Geobacteraceae bacterium]